MGRRYRLHAFSLLFVPGGFLMGRYNWRLGHEIRKILRVGHSYMVALPPHYLERLDLKKGDLVSIEQREGELVIKSLGKATKGGL